MSRNFHARVRKELEALADDQLREIAAEFLANHQRPAIRAEPVDEGKRKINLAWWEKVIGRDEKAPGLAAKRSKYGGLPYLQSADHWPRVDDGRRDQFIGQLNFAEIDAPDPLPDEGILVVFKSPGEPKFEEAPFQEFRVLWYPNGPRKQPAELERPVPSIEFEVPLELSVVRSHRLPGTWEDVAREAGASGDALVVGDELEEVEEAVRQTRGTIGAPPDFGIEGPGPRQWCGSSPPADVEEWRELWRPLGGRGRWGSVEHSLMIPARALEQNRLEMCYTLIWQ